MTGDNREGIGMQSDEDDDALLFLEEDDAVCGNDGAGAFATKAARTGSALWEARPPGDGWVVLIVDDVEDVHDITRLTLSALEFDDRPLTFLGAFSAAEARAVLLRRDDVALILLDVVMEDDHAGLDLVRWIREDLGNGLVRIILRTGQPGEAPERRVIGTYNINDYMAKTELTATRLFTGVISALRAYRDLVTIENSRRSLESIVAAGTELYRERRRVRVYLRSLLAEFERIFMLPTALLVHLEPEGEAALASIAAAAGDWAELLDKLAERLPEPLAGLAIDTLRKPKIILAGQHLAMPVDTPSRHRLSLLAAIEPDKPAPDRAMLALFVNMASAGLENALLNERLEGRLATAEQRLSDALDSSTDGFALWDADDRLAMCNARYREVFSDLERLLHPGEAFADVLSEELEAGIYDARVEDREALADRRLALHRLGGRLELLCADGRWLLITERRTDNGGTISLTTDITDLKAREAAMTFARQEAEAASKAKSQFLAVMSHEIRTPMNGILGMTGLLLDTDLDDIQRDYLETVEYSGQSLLTVLNDILDFSKMEVGQLAFETLDFDLERTVTSVTTLMSSRAHEKGVRIEAEIADDLPRFLRGDAPRLRQVLLNLVGNAVKFTEDGVIQVRVHAEAATETGAIGVRFEVIDTGIGIAKEHRDRLFRSFSQADLSISRRFGGTGLGLAICRKIVEMQNGRIGVDSEFGQGSTFWFILAFQPGEEPLRKNRSKMPRVRPLSILLAEDNQVNQRVAAGLLGKHGHKVTVAENGREVMAAITGPHAFDIILMDIQMPEMNGLEATEAIRALKTPVNRIPVIALTANGLVEDEMRCRAAGMSDFVRKPINPAHLAAAIARCMPSSVIPDNEPVAVDGKSVDGKSDGAMSGGRQGNEERGMATPGKTAPDVGSTDPTALEKLPRFDPAALKLLESEFGAEMMQELVADMIGETRARQSQLADLPDDGDVATLRRVAHDLKGMVGSLGLHRVHRLAEALEYAYRDGDLATGAAIKPRIGDLLEDAIAAVREHLSGVAA